MCTKKKASKGFEDGLVLKRLEFVLALTGARVVGRGARRAKMSLASEEEG